MAQPIASQVKRLRDACESLLRRHGKTIEEHQWAQRRIAHAAMDIFAQVATVSRASSKGDTLSDKEHHTAETFVTRAARRVDGNYKTLEHNDDERMRVIAGEAYAAGGYEYSLY